LIKSILKNENQLQRGLSIMGNDNASTLAQRVWEHWQSGQAMPHFAALMRPTTREAGYAAQAALAGLVGAQLAGWKIAATSEAGQKHIGVSGPLAGRIFADRIKPLGAAISLAGNRMCVAEPEMTFQFARDLPPRTEPYTAAEVMDAVADLYIAVEVPNSRFADFVHAGEASLIADNACAHEYVKGAAAPAAWRTLDLAAHAVTAAVVRGDGQAWHRAGSGAAVLGDPRVALRWLVNELRVLGLGTQAGLFVTTGTCMQPLEVTPGDTVEVDFGVLGRLSVDFEA
jgi:2-keto-4-pentenoate hydratase